jgi:predicted dehydrogenase
MNDEVLELRNQVKKLELAVEKANEKIRFLDRHLQTVTQPERFRCNHLLYVAIMGARGHGKQHIKNFLAIPECRIAYICDVDLAVGNAAANEIEKSAGYRPKVVQDFRHALDDKDVDILSIVAPHHWHALAAIWAMQAGKHVYLEKPISHTFLEGEEIVAAARKYRKVIQAGTQLRSNMSLRAASDFIRSGGLGKVKVAHCITYKPRPAMPQADKISIPASVDYDLWCGPAEKNPLNRSHFHYHWHWFWEFGNGALGNNGIHRIDVARIGLGLRGFGDTVLSYGGRFGEQDTGETPNMQAVVHQFGDTWIFHDIIGLPKKPFKTVRNGIIFYGTEGLIIYQSGAAVLADPDGNILSQFAGKQENHYRNFIDAVIEGNPEKLAGNIYEGHVSSGLCHLGNISYRLGALATDNQITAALEDLKAPGPIKSQLARFRLNLQANKDDRQLLLGRKLHIDPKHGHIINDDQAAAMMSKSYRQGFGLTRE